MKDRVLNLFDGCPAESVGRRVYLFFLGAHRTPTKVNKNGAVAKVSIFVELGILKHLKTFRVISNENVTFTFYLMLIQF